MNEGEEGKKGVCIGGQREHRERCTQGGNVRKGVQGSTKSKCINIPLW